MAPDWNDARMDDLAKRVDVVAADVKELRPLPERVGRIEERTETLVGNVDTLRLELNARFDTIDRAHAVAARRLVAATTPPTWTAKLKDTTAVMLPIIVALIAAFATISAATGQ